MASTGGYSINRLEKEWGFPRSSISKYNKNIPSMEKVQKNDETAEMAQALFENKNLRVLFDAAKDATPEDLKTTYDMLMALKKKERGIDEL